jgi:hypothetical protein
LFLSWKVTWPPVRFWAQPSGYFIEKPSLASLKVRKFWLSGMSPAAVEAASDEPEETLEPQERGFALAVGVVVGAVAPATEELVELPLDPDPHPARATAKTNSVAANSTETRW